MKVDAPSGTALLLGEAAAEGRAIPLDDHSVRGGTAIRAPGARAISVLPPCAGKRRRRPQRDLRRPRRAYRTQSSRRGPRRLCTGRHPGRALGSWAAPGLLHDGRTRSGSRISRPSGIAATLGSRSGIHRWSGIGSPNAPFDLFCRRAPGRSCVLRCRLRRRGGFSAGVSHRAAASGRHASRQGISGFRNLKTGVAIVTIEMPAEAYPSIVASFADEALKAQGFTLKSRETLRDWPERRDPDFGRAARCRPCGSEDVSPRGGSRHDGAGDRAGSVRSGIIKRRGAALRAEDGDVPAASQHRRPDRSLAVSPGRSGRLPSHSGDERKFHPAHGRPQ